MIILAAAFLLTGVWVLLQWGTATALGIESTQMSLGFGPRIWAQGRFRLNLLPIGGFVAFKSEQVSPLSYVRFAVLTLAPWLTFAGIVAVAGAGISDFVAGATLVVRATDVYTHWGAWSELLRSAPISSMARLGARLIAVNVLPMGTFAGGALVVRLLPERHRQKFVEYSWWVFVGLFVSGLVWALLRL